ncbi:flagellar assembly protein H, partial [Myxacorys almedinensis A]|nr:flagellar assembly protein H [Myxacorys almedinensis A]
IAAAYVLSGLKLEGSVIARIIRRDVMRESVTYQAILREGREENRQEIALNLLREGISIDIISRSTGLSIAAIQQLQQQLEQT